MRKEFLEKNIISNCPYCDPNSFALRRCLDETRHFRIVCDVHPIVKGHILIIPKAHYSCIGEYPQEAFEEFENIFSEVSGFVKETLGSVSSFEHGRSGQTIFHSHIHLFPFGGTDPLEVIPEGRKFFRNMTDFGELRKLLAKDKGYLYFSLGDKFYTVDISIGQPRFFRDRFAKILGNEKRGNWKMMVDDRALMETAEKEISELVGIWKGFKF